MTVVLRAITVHRFRNVAPETTLRFRESFNVLLGKNATGKTTLLDLISAARSLDFSAFAREAFSFSFQLAHGNQTLAVDVENVHQAQPSESGRGDPIAQRLAQQGLFSANATVTISEGSSVILRGACTKGRVTLELRGKKDPIERTSTASLSEDHLFLSFMMPNPPWPSKWDGDIMNLLGGFWGDPTVQRFDESLHYFENVVIGEGAIRVYSDESEPRMGKRSEAFYCYADNAPEELATEAKKLLDADNEIATLQIRNTPMLGLLAQQMGFQSATIYAQRDEKSPQNGPFRASFSAFRFEFTRHDGSTINHNWLSYGQKRLVAFYFWLGTYPGLAVADELVNGLHHAWIDGCVAALQGRQAFLTTQNPLLLDYLPFESEGEVAEAFAICKSALEDGRERIHWSNIGEKESHTFYRAYKTGIQHVSEILATRGLW